MKQDEAEVRKLADRFLGAWNVQRVDKVLACYTEDLVYRDPNTRGSVNGREAMGRYLTKLFSKWTMHWSLREAFPLAGVEGAAVLWRASLRAASGSTTVETDGMDLVLLRDGLICRNEVYFDRAGLAGLL